MKIGLVQLAGILAIGSASTEATTAGLETFRKEVERCNVLGIPNLVFHPGSHVRSGAEAGMRRIARNMNRVLDDIVDNSVTLCLEATAGTGDNLGRTFEELAQIMDMIDDAGNQPFQPFHQALKRHLDSI